MRYDSKILSLVVLAAALCTFLLSGCGANVCAFGHIGECQSTLPPNDNQNNVSSSGALSLMPDASEVVRGGTLNIRYKGGQNTRITLSLGTIGGRNASSFTFVAPAVGTGTGRQTAVITLKAADYKEEYVETAPQNKGKFAKASIEITD